MIPWTSIYWLSPLSAACICAFVAGYLFSHRSQPGAMSLTLLMAAVGVWSFAYAMEFHSPLVETKLMWVKSEYIGASWVGFFSLHFILVITGKNKWLTVNWYLCLSAIPVAIPILAFTNGYHRLMWASAWLELGYPKPVMAYARGVGFWIFVGYSYALLSAGTVILLTAYRRTAKISRGRINTILMGIAIPWLSNALYVTKSGPIKALDMTPFAFTLSGIIFCIGLFKFQLLDIMPIAREALLEAISDAVLVLDLQDCIVDKNPRADALLEKDSSQAFRQNDANLYPEIFDSVKKLKEQQSNQSEIEIRRNGDKKNFDIRLSPLFSGKDRQVGWLVCLRDITGSRQAEVALRDSEERFRSISDNALDGIIMMDPGGKVSFWNHAAETIFGYSDEEIIGKDLHTLLAPQRYHKEYCQRFSEFLETGAGPVMGKTVELSALNKSGAEFPVELSISKLCLKGQLNTIGIVRDITARKRDEAEKAMMQEQLQRAHKMEAIGTLAGGVAHDLNNILSGIVSYPDLLLMQIQSDSPLRKPIQTMRESGQKAAAIVEDLLTLARRGVATHEALCLNTVIRDYLASPECNKLAAAHPLVRISTHLSENLPNIMGSPLHLSKTLMNLVMNAAEAMPGGGFLQIRTDSIYRTPPAKEKEEMAAGDCVTLTIIDTGIGIPAKDRDRIFEPFYTKKQMGKSGTGLGMAVVWGTVQDHGGTIDIESTEGKGTTFTLYFPTTSKQQKLFPAAVKPEPQRGNGETILVVDDMPDQRTIAAAMLHQLGYTVETVDCGKAALRFLSDRPVDLVILDMIMDPDMDGLDTYLEIQKQTPGQKVLIASGFSETDRIHSAKRLGVGAYIKKPYAMATLALTVRRELEKLGASPLKSLC